MNLKFPHISGNAAVQAEQTKRYLYTLVNDLNYLLDEQSKRITVLEERIKVLESEGQ